MTHNQNPEIERNIIDSFKLQRQAGGVPSNLNSVTPVVDVNPLKINLIKRATVTGTIHTCSSDKNTYIVSSLLNQRLALGAENLQEVTLTCTPKGAAATTINKLASYRDAASSVNRSSNINHPPILLERGSNVTLTTDNYGEATVYFIEVEVPEV